MRQPRAVLIARIHTAADADVGQRIRLRVLGVLGLAAQCCDVMQTERYRLGACVCVCSLQ